MSTETKRGRGRPANFPNVETAARLYNLPTATIAMVERIAAKREVPLGIALDTMIQRAFKEMNRKK